MTNPATPKTLALCQGCGACAGLLARRLHPGWDDEPCDKKEWAGSIMDLRLLRRRLWDQPEPTEEEK